MTCKTEGLARPKKAGESGRVGEGGISENLLDLVREKKTGNMR
jgi:hypothetical protein